MSRIGAGVEVHVADFGSSSYKKGQNLGPSGRARRCDAETHVGYRSFS